MESVIELAVEGLYMLRIELSFLLVFGGLWAAGRVFSRPDKARKAQGAALVRRPSRRPEEAVPLANVDPKKLQDRRTSKVESRKSAGHATGSPPDELPGSLVEKPVEMPPGGEILLSFFFPRELMFVAARTVEQRVRKDCTDQSSIAIDIHIVGKRRLRAHQSVFPGQLVAAVQAKNQCTSIAHGYTAPMWACLLFPRVPNLV